MITAGGLIRAAEQVETDEHNVRGGYRRLGAMTVLGVATVQYGPGRRTMKIVIYRDSRGNQGWMTRAVNRPGPVVGGTL